VSNYETLCANAVRRALRAHEKEVVPRVSDLDALAASTGGKVEFEALEDGREGAIMQQLIAKSVLDTFKSVAPGEKIRDVVAAFEAGAIAHVGEDLPSAELAKVLTEVPALREPVLALTGGNESPAMVASAIEFMLEGLHLSKRLNKDRSSSSATYRARG
jgi:magnesium chelatase subunit I